MGDHHEKGDDPELGPITTKFEIYGWWIFDFASSIFVYSVITFLLPELFTSLADEVAVNGYVTLLGLKMQPSSFITYTITASVIVQTPIFIAIGAVADVGGYRYKLLIVCSIIACIICALYFFMMAPIPYWIGGVLLILNNIAVGSTSIFYNSFLPLLVKNHHKVREAKTPQEEKELTESVGNRISSIGINAGFVGGTIFLIVNIAILSIFPEQCLPGCHACTPEFEDDPIRCPHTCPTGYNANHCDHAYWGMRFNILLAAIWWFGFSIFTFVWLKPRSSPPLPPGENIVLHSLSKMWAVAKRPDRLPTAARFIFGYWVYSDGMATLLFGFPLLAISKFGFHAAEVGVLTVIINVFAIAGNYAFLMASRKFPNIFSAKVIVAINLTMFLVFPIYARLPGTFASKAELFILGAWYGFGIASIQGFSRGLLSRLAPNGCEGVFFSFFEFTNKYTSPLGPFVMSFVSDATGDLRWGVFMISLFLLTGLGLLLSVNEEKGFQEAQNYTPTHQMEMQLVPTTDGEERLLDGQSHQDDDEESDDRHSSVPLDDEDDDRSRFSTRLRDLNDD